MMDAGKDFELIDVREPNEYEIVSIPGATLIPKDEILLRPGAVAAAAATSRSCCTARPVSARPRRWPRSRTAGFKDAVHVQGGVTAWATRIDKALPTY